MTQPPLFNLLRNEPVHSDGLNLELTILDDQTAAATLGCDINQLDAVIGPNIVFVDVIWLTDDNPYGM